MINLIPPDAKKRLVLEYWVRVTSVWCYVWATTLAVGVALLIPTYVLITLQVSAYGDLSANASEKEADFEALSKNLEVANQQAATIKGELSAPTMSSYIERFSALEDGGVKISRVSIDRSEGKPIGLTLTGEAIDRQSLAAFRDRIQKDELVEKVDFPISNLAKDKEIPFNISVTIKK